MLRILLRSRFDDDPRIDRIAARLAEGDPVRAFRAASTQSLDELDN